MQTLATAIAMTGGSLLLSDDLPKLPEERLRIAEVLLPVIGERARVRGLVRCRDALQTAAGPAQRHRRVAPPGQSSTGQRKATDLCIDPNEFDLPAAEYRGMRILDR